MDRESESLYIYIFILDFHWLKLLFSSTLPFLLIPFSRIWKAKVRSHIPTSKISASWLKPFCLRDPSLSCPQMSSYIILPAPDPHIFYHSIPQLYVNILCMSFSPRGCELPGCRGSLLFSLTLPVSPQSLPGSVRPVHVSKVDGQMNGWRKPAPPPGGIGRRV